MESLKITKNEFNGQNTTVEITFNDQKYHATVPGKKARDITFSYIPDFCIYVVNLVGCETSNVFELNGEPLIINPCEICVMNYSPCELILNVTCGRSQPMKSKSIDCGESIIVDLELKNYFKYNKNYKSFPNLLTTKPLKSSNIYSYCLVLTLCGACYYYYY
jgi:hypothetical protein